MRSQSAVTNAMAAGIRSRAWSVGARFHQGVPQRAVPRGVRQIREVMGALFIACILLTPIMVYQLPTV